MGQAVQEAFSKLGSPRLNKKLLLALMIVVSTLTAFSPTRGQQASAAGQEPNKRPAGTLLTNPAISTYSGTNNEGNNESQVLEMQTRENVTLPGGDASPALDVQITISPGRLANLYRRMFGVSNITTSDMLVPVSVSVPESHGLEFLNSIEHQQQLSLGVAADISNSFITPLTEQGGFRASLQGSAHWNTAQGSSSYTWRAFLGYRGQDATNVVTQNVFSSLMFTQWLLQNVTGASQYKTAWDTRIILPPGATLLNGADISKLNWRVDFGSGSYLAASTSQIDASTINLEEVMVVTPQHVTATPDSAVALLSSYKSFEIDYLTPHSSYATALEPLMSVADDPSCDFPSCAALNFTANATPDIPRALPHGAVNIPAIELCVPSSTNSCASVSGSISIIPTMSASLALHLGWDAGNSFETSFQANASATVKFDASISGDLTGSKEVHLLGEDGALITTFWIGLPFPPFIVWIDLRFDPKLELTAGLDGTLELSGGVSLSDNFTAGLSWHCFDDSNCNPNCDRVTDPVQCTGWQPVLKNKAKANAIDTTIYADVKATADIGLPLELKALVYSVAGPKVEFKPFIHGEITLASTGNPPPSEVQCSGAGCWKIDLRAEIDSGVDFESFVASVLHLSSISITICPGQYCPINPWPEPLLPLANGNIGKPLFSISMFSNSSTVFPVPGSSIDFEGTAMRSGSPVYPGTVALSIFGSSSNPLLNVTTATNSTGGYSVAIPACIQLPFQPVILCAPAGRYLVQPAINGFSVPSASLVVTVIQPDTTSPIIKPIVTVGLGSGSYYSFPSPPEWIGDRIQLGDGSYVQAKNVTVVWRVEDPESGIASTSGCNAKDNTIINLPNNETAGTVFTCQATNGSGNTASANVTIRIDATPPKITGASSLGPNANGWNKSPVTVSWSFFNPISGVASSTGCETTTVIAEGTTILSCSATSSAGLSSSASVTVRIDRTPPFATGCSSTPSPNVYGWHNTNVMVKCTFDDSASGIANLGDTLCVQVIGVICPGIVVQAILPTEGTNQTVRLCDVDRAGNAGCAVVGQINIDTTPPTISSIQDGQAFILRQAVLANAQCTDALSGLDPVFGCIIPTGFIETNIVGTHSYTVTSTDRAGNTAVLIVRFQVHYNFTLVSPQPAGLGTQLGRTFPVRFRLTDALGNFVSTTTARIWVDSLSNPGKSSGSSNLGNYFRHDSTENQYLFNLSTKEMTAGSHTIYVTLDDGTVHTILVKLTT